MPANKKTDKGEYVVEEKTLNISEVNGARKNIKDIEVYGDGDTFALLCKASSQAEGWMKSTKVCNVQSGCIVQVTTQQKNHDGNYVIAEALAYVPGVQLDKESEPRKLVSLQELMLAEFAKKSSKGEE